MLSWGKRIARQRERETNEATILVVLRIACRSFSSFCCCQCSLFYSELQLLTRVGKGGRQVNDFERVVRIGTKRESSKKEKTKNKKTPKLINLDEEDRKALRIIQSLLCREASARETKVILISSSLL